jgi:hypothetical protein
VILLLRALSRALAFVLLTVLALACLAAAGFAIPRSGLATLGDLTHTDTAAGQSRDFLDRLEDGEMPAGAAAGAGLAAVVGLVLVAGAVLPRRERTLPMDDGPEGRVTARRRPLRLAAAALAARPAEVTRSKAGVRGRYRRAGGRLRVCVHRRPEAQAKPLAEQVRGQLEGLTNAFALRTRVRTRRDESRRRLR